MDVLAYLDKSIATYDADPPANDYQRGHLDALKVARAELASGLVDDDLGACELCDRPLAHGQFVNQYNDVGTAHANCEKPFARPSEETPAPGDDGTTMPTYVLLGVPALLYDLVPGEAVREAGAELPIPMLLFCPACGKQHIDEPDPADDWENPPHTSHKCVGPGGCGAIWRPADIPTAGIAAIDTRGKKDTHVHLGGTVWGRVLDRGPTP